MSTYVLVLGVVVEERDPFGGIVDIDRPPADAAEKELQKGIREALQEKIDAGRRVGSASVSRAAIQSLAMYEKMPFNGTISHEVILYCE